MIEVFESASLDIPPRVAWYFPTAERRQRVFVVVLRASGLADLELPVSSISMRLRDTSGSYVSVTVPNPTLYTSAILARTSGRMHVFSGYLTAGETRTLEEIVYANIDNVYFNMGSSNTLTISGSRYISASNPKEVEITDASRVAKKDGRFTVRAPFDIFIRPLDIASIDGEQFEVDLISATVTATSAHMDIEGDAI